MPWCLRASPFFLIFAKNYHIMKHLIKSFVIAVAIICPVAASSQNVKVNDVITTLADGDITLNGYLHDAIVNSMEHWNKGVVPYDSLMAFYARDGHKGIAFGEMWAKAVRSGSILYGYTHDAQLRDILTTTVNKVFKYQRPNGILSCWPVNKQPHSKSGDIWERKYVMLGLSEYLKHVDNDPWVRALMIREANSVVDQIGDAPKTDIWTQGWSKTGIETFSVFEPMMRVYKMTGDEKYLDFCRYLIRKGGNKGVSIFTQALDNVLPKDMGNGYPKAYEMVSVFEGLVEYYRCTGDEKARECFTNFFNNIKKYEITLIGNGGADQPYAPRLNGEGWDNTALEQSNPRIKRMMETCAGVEWLRFCDQVLRISGDPTAVEYMERYIYNGLIGGMKPTGDGFSYVNLFNGRKAIASGWGGTVAGVPMTCCNLSGPTGLAYIPFVDIMQASNGPVINLYNNATASFATPSGRKAKLTVAGDFPYGNKIDITLRQDTVQNYVISLYMPTWSANTEVRVNGKKVKAGKSGDYLRLSRTWHDGDRITVAFDMQARLVESPHGSNEEGWNRQAVVYGPIVLTRDENIDANYNQPVVIKADKRGRVRVEQVKPQMQTTRMEFIVPTTTGSIHMVDYASADSWSGKNVCTWMPRK